MFYKIREGLGLFLKIVNDLFSYIYWILIIVLFKNIFSDYNNEALFIKEISQDRTEIRLASTTLSNDVIENTVNSLIEEINNSIYYVDYLLNFGTNEQYVAVNVALNKAPDGYEILFKLFKGVINA